MRDSVVEAVCEYNGQSVLFDCKLELPLSEHDCGYDDCPLCYTHEDVHKEMFRNREVQPLDLNEADWGMASDWADDLEDFNE